MLRLLFAIGERPLEHAGETSEQDLIYTAQPSDFDFFFLASYLYRQYSDTFIAAILLCHCTIAGCGVLSHLRIAIHLVSDSFCKALKQPTVT